MMTSPIANAYYPSRRPFPLSQYPSLSRIRSLFRPSVRLKTSLYSLSLLILILIILALNTAHISTSPPVSESVLGTAPPQYSSADSMKLARGRDGHLVDEEIYRSWGELSFGLLSNKQPSQIGCDVPLDGPEGEKGVLVFLGIFSERTKKERRDL